MTLRTDMKPWVTEALGRLSGEATIDSVAEDIWVHHEADIRAHTKGLWTWQYEMRWAAQSLQDSDGTLIKTGRTWKLVKYP